MQLRDSGAGRGKIPGICLLLDFIKNSNFKNYTEENLINFNNKIKLIKNNCISILFITAFN
jgi:hypothetical protein